MLKKLQSHHNVMYSQYPRIKSKFNKGFFVIGLFRYRIFYNGHLVGKMMENGALMVNWNRLKNAGYIDGNIQ